MKNDISFIEKTVLLVSLVLLVPLFQMKESQLIEPIEPTKLEAVSKW